MKKLLIINYNTVYNYLIYLLSTQKLVGALMFIAISFNSVAGDISVTGATNTCPGYTDSYTVALNPGYCFFYKVWTANWTIIGGEFVSGNTNTSTVFVKWNTDGPKSITATIFEPFTSCANTVTATLTGITMMVPFSAPPPPPPTTPILSPGTLELCPGSTINLTTSNPSASYPIRYRWYVNINNGGFNQFSFTSLASTSYNVPNAASLNNSVIVDFKVTIEYMSCPNYNPQTSASLSARINAPPPSGSISQLTPRICSDGGTIRFTMTGGTSSTEYFVQINGIPENPKFTGSNYDYSHPWLIPGSYDGQIFYVDNSNPPHGPCSMPFSFTIAEGSYALSLSESHVNVTCNGGSNGGVDLTVNNGTNPYTYSWNSGQTQQDIIGIPSGSYSVTVKDVHLCTGTISNINISQPGLLSVPVAAVTSGSLPFHNGRDISCIGASDGQITFNVPTGGSGIYQYSIDNGSNYQYDNIFSNLPEGTNFILIRDDNDHSCTKSGTSVTINNPPAITPGTTSIIHPNCAGATSTTGNLSISSSSGGTGPFKWSIGGAFQDESSPFINVDPGIYSITIKDNNGCTASASSVTINEPISASYSSTPAACSLVNDGSLTIESPSGGKGPYTYALNNGSFDLTNNFTNQAAGSSYTLKVKDFNGCEFNISNASVGLKPPVSGIITQTSSINCYGQSTASLTVAPSGGSGSYSSYTWSNDGNTQNVSSLPAGSYNVTITDNKGCSGVASNGPFPVAQPPLLTTTLNVNSVLCKGGNSGSISLIVSGGTGTKTFLWSNGAVTQNISQLTIGNYSVIVTDANSCTTSGATTVSEPSTSVSVSLQSKTDVTCHNAANGSITVAASGGTGALSFSKDGSNFQGSPTFSGLSNGSYTISAKDVNGCTQATSTIAIVQPAAPLSFASITKLNPSCFGASNGNIQANGSGGTTPYQYSRDGVNFSSSGSILDLAAGNYVVTIKDANNCTFNSTTQTLIDPPVISASAIPASQSCIEIVDGKITVTASGGTGILNYSIDGTAFQTGNIFTGLTSGNYTIYVQDDNSCQKTTSVNVGLVSPIAGTISQTAFINCFGQSTAALDLSVSGGTPGYTFNWSNGPTSQNINNLVAGNYDVSITDSKGCAKSSQFLVTQPALLQASTITSNFNGYGVTCAGASDGFINLTVSGGTSPYSYSWSNGANNKNISGIGANNYDVTVTDSKTCAANASATLLSPAPVSVLLDNKLDVTCFGGFNGSIEVSGTGGTGNFNYSFNNDTWGPQALFSDLTEGEYTVQSKDENNCVSLNTLTATITQPSEINVLLSNYVDATCGQANGSIEASASGGTGDINYEWLDPMNNVIATTAVLDNVVSGAYSLTVADFNNCIQTVPAIVGSYDGAQYNIDSIIGVTCPDVADGKAEINILSGHAPFSFTWGNGETATAAVQLPRGQNTVTVTDANNCAVASTFIVPSPVPITLSSIQKNLPDCPGGNNGSIEVSAVGGTGAYTYKWGGLNGSSSLLNIPAGNYSLIIEDSQNCNLSQIITLNDKALITIDVVNLVTPSCSYSSDGSLQVNASGGNGSFKYDWDNGAATSAINKLQGGTYVVTVSDLKNCSQQKSIPLIQPDEINGQVISSTDVSCYGGSNGAIIVEATGGNGSFEFSINSGNTWKSQNSFTNLTAGEISVIGRDKLGCLVYFEFSLEEPTQLTANITDLVHTSCNLPNGSASVQAAGGTEPYAYQWTNSSNLVVENSASLKTALADDYQVVVTDGNLCAVSSSLKINASANSIFNVKDISATLCTDSEDGSATLEIVSAASPYSVLWSSGETGLSATKLSSGISNVTITDANGCKAQSDFTVPNATPITITDEIISDPLCTNANGSIQVFVNGGTAPYSFFWNEKPGNSFNQELKAATHQLVIQDANNCSLSGTYTLTDPPLFVIDLGPDKTVCSGTTVNIGVDIPQTTFSWTGPNNFQSTSSIVTIAEEGAYLLEATSNLGCKAQDSFVLTLTDNLLNADFLTTTKAFVNDEIMIIDISWPVPTSVLWNFPPQATILVSTKDYAIIQFAEPGLYPVSLLAHLGNCRSTYSQNIMIEERPASGGRQASTEIPKIVSISAYPNPFAQTINLNVEMNVTANVDLKVYHLMSNKLVYQSELQGESHYNVQLDFGNRDSGIYAVIASVANHVQAIRIIKE